MKGHGCGGGGTSTTSVKYLSDKIAGSPFREDVSGVFAREGNRGRGCSATSSTAEDPVALPNPIILRGSKGVPRNGGRKSQLVCLCFAISSSRVQTPLGPPLVPLNREFKDVVFEDVVFDNNSSVTPY